MVPARDSKGHLRSLFSSRWPRLHPRPLCAVNGDVEDATLWSPAAYDVVFCRNVIMYFTPETMRNVVTRIARSLVPDGYLFLGHAETLRGISRGFHLCHTHGAFYYQKRGDNDTPQDATTSYVDQRSTAAKALPLVLEVSDSWVQAIQQASERIASLANSSNQPQLQASSPPIATPAPAARSWDLGLVLEAMRQERFVDALALLSALPVESRGEPDALLLRAILLTNSGKLTEAEDTCNRLLTQDELNAGAHYVMALCQEHMGNIAGAIEQDQTAIYLDSSFAMPRLHMGLVSRRAGDIETARHELSHALILLAQEDASRLLLFGGGFSRETLLSLCRSELRAAGGDQ